MYDFNRQPFVAIGVFTNESLCYYLPKISSINILQKKPYHYVEQRKNEMIQMAQSIFKELFYYSKSLEKVNSKIEERNVLNIMFENIKSIIIYNGDKYGIIPEQRTFYLVVSYLHSKLYQQIDMREFLNEVHWLLLAKNTQNEEQLPFAFTALLNGQFQELLEYIKSKFSPFVSVQNLQNLIDLILFRIENRENSSIDLNIKKKIEEKLKKLISTNERFKILLKLLNQLKKINASPSLIFEQQYELQIIIAILVGNEQIISLASYYSWAIYLNLYINYVDFGLNSNKNKKNYQTIVKNFQKNITKTNKNKNIYLNDEQTFILNLIDSFSLTRTHSFHEIYQKSFNIFSPLLCHLFGMLILQSKIVDLFSIFNNKDYYEQISLHLLESASQTSWSSLVHMIGFLEHSLYFKQAPYMVDLWQSLLFKYLPYDLSSNSKDQVKKQIREIEQKIQDLNLIGLRYITKSYLNSVFKLELNPKNSQHKLNEIILELFFMNLEILDNNNANECMHQIKIFMKNYYKNYQFDYKMIDCLEFLFEKKQNILDKKTIQKIHSLFKLIYKIGQIYSEVTEEGNGQIEFEQKKEIMNQLRKFNKLFEQDGHNRRSITLCVQLLKLGKFLLKKIQQCEIQLNIQNQQQMIQIQKQQKQHIFKKQDQRKIIKTFKRNLMNYFKEWNYNRFQPLSDNSYEKEALQLLKYFDSYLF